MFRISETHWIQAGQKIIASKEVLSNPGHEEENASNSQVVTLMVSKEAREARIGWESRGRRIIKGFFEKRGLQ
ncbi:unnamed protein product [Schistosoma curassoni]|uniref:Transposase n=1 Tax=Schistosoma curassoni TaxID=6186 RepID=A0A183JXN8_9TREM|nr:unnamed protein product [Schistosoma curassoni]